MEISLNEIENIEKDKIEFLDVRSRIAYEHGHIPGAVPFDYECFRRGNISLSKTKMLVVYCTMGEQSRTVAEELRKEGYEAFNLTGGYREWLIREYEELDEEELRRYDRQLILPEVGVEGQKKLKKARVLIIGAGGLGAPAALYLAAAGIGTIGIADEDSVCLSNLHRQIIHSQEGIGMNKAVSAAKGMEKINPDIAVIPYAFRITPDNIESLLKEYDFVLDCVDNFETKFLINDACVLHGKPFCHGGILRFQGQVMTWVPGEYPCYRCIFEEIPERGSIPNCSQAGVIGAAAGIIGCIQALETVKYFLSAGELLTGKMLVFDGLTMKFRIVQFKGKSPFCRVCGEEGDIRDIISGSSRYTGTGACSIQKG